MKELVDAFSRSSYSRYNRDTNQFAQLFIIQMIATSLQLIIHVQRHHHLHVHVNQLCREIEVAFEVRCIHDIYNKVRSFLDDMLADINFFG